MNGLAILAILLVSIVPLYAQAQQPDTAKLKADAQKVVSTIRSNEAKTRDCPCGEAANYSGRNISAACTHWRSCSTGERQRHRRRQKQKSCHVLIRGPNVPQDYGSANL